MRHLAQIAGGLAVGAAALLLGGCVKVTLGVKGGAVGISLEPSDVRFRDALRGAGDWVIIEREIIMEERILPVEPIEAYP